MIKQKLNNLPIKHKLNLLTLGIALFVILIMSSAFIFAEYLSKRDTLRESATTLTRILAVNSTAAIAFNDTQTAAEVLGALKEVPTAISAIIYDVHGEPFVKYKRLLPDEQMLNDAQLPILDIERNPFNRSEFLKGQIVVYHDIIESDRLIGFIKVNLSLDKLKQSQFQLILIALLSAIVAMVLAYIFSHKLQKLIAYPIEALANTVAGVSAEKDYSRRAQKYSNDELGELTEGFNAMLNQIQLHQIELNDAKIVAEDAKMVAEDAKITAEEANQTKTTFLSRMSHELRTPLNAIIGFATLLQMRHNDLTPENDKVSTEHILLAGQHLLMLINDIMDVVNFEQQEIEITLHDCPLQQTIEQSITLVQSQADTAGITLHAQPTSLSITANHDRLKQVLINLLTNGVKYNQPNGSVAIEVSETDDGFVEIIVRDSGIGINDKDFEAIFEPFTRLRYAEQHEIQGTGIGLALTKFLVLHMNGKIEIQSEQDVGSIFKLTFAKVDSASQQSSATATPTNGLSLSQENKQKILYIEDNPASRVLLESLLSDYPQIELLTANNGEDGVEMANAQLPQLIFIDINLPKMSGITAIKILKGNLKLSDTKMFALSADVLPEQINKAMLAGFDDYLTKPIDMKAFIRIVEEA